MKQLKHPPVSSAWAFSGYQRGYEIWLASSGKVYWRRISDGTWWTQGKERTTVYKGKK